MKKMTFSVALTIEEDAAVRATIENLSEFIPTMPEYDWIIVEDFLNVNLAHMLPHTGWERIEVLKMVAIYNLDGFYRMMITTHSKDDLCEVFITDNSLEFLDKLCEETKIMYSLDNLPDDLAREAIETALNCDCTEVFTMPSRCCVNYPYCCCAEEGIFDDSDS